MHCYEQSKEEYVGISVDMLSGYTHTHTRLSRVSDGASEYGVMLALLEEENMFRREATGSVLCRDCLLCAEG